MPRSERRDLVDRLARFGIALRESGIEVDLKGEIAAADALGRVDLLDRDDVRRALRIALRIPRPDWPLYETLFDAWWGGGEPPPRPTFPEPERLGNPAGLKEAWRPGRPVPAPPGGREREAPAGDEPGYTRDAILRSKPFDQWSDADLPAMERLVRRLARRLATRRSRRLVPAPARGRPDLRRSLRGALATGGEVVRLARRDRRVERPDLVLVCDTSGSMDPYTRFLLAFVLSLRRVVRSCEIFAFNTTLTRLTPLVRPGRVAESLQAMTAAVPDWSGGTRIGDCLAELVEEHPFPRSAVVVVLSDGLDLGDTATLEDAMRRIRRRARRVVWLNPLLGSPRYEPTARGMVAALPYVDHFAPAHDLASLERLVPQLTATGRRD